MKPNILLTGEESLKIQQRFGLQVQELHELLKILPTYLKMPIPDGGPEKMRLRTRIRALAAKANSP